MTTLAWSATRARTLQTCRRRYYYQYHLAPLVRRPEPPPAAVEADRLRSLTGLESWAGTVVHELIEVALNRWRAGREYGEGEALSDARRWLRRQYRDSREYWTAHPETFRTRPALLDLHFYGNGTLSRERAVRIREIVEVALLNFLRSEPAARARSLGRSAWLPIDRNAAARLESGVLVLVKPDFALRDGDRLFVYDWKTGKPDPFWETVQVTCYALYGAQKWGQPVERIIPQIVHLYPEYRLSPAATSEEGLRDIRVFIEESHEEMAALQGDPESGELPPIERFPPCEECQSCRWCPFRGMCEGARRLQESVAAATIL
jgi:hypothetical protein